MTLDARILRDCDGDAEEADCLLETCEEVADGSLSAGVYTFTGPRWAIYSNGTYRRLTNEED